MRMVVTAATAVVALVLTGGAQAASMNTYTATLSASQTGAGTEKEPVALGLVQTLSARPAAAGGDLNADPLTDIRLSLPRAGFSATGFPVCTAARIAAANTDAGCPAGALIASGQLTAVLWSPAAPAKTTPCDPLLDAWNAGRGRVTEFLRIPAGHQCAGLQTGTLAPWSGSLRESGTTLIDDTPFPPPVSTDVGGLGLSLSLETETVTWTRQTRTRGDRATAYFQSLGCVAGRRPYSVAFTSTAGGTQQTSAVSGSATC